MAAFMEVLDISIANVSLSHIAGSLSASQEEATWVLTSYLVSNAIVLPISGWFSPVLGRKRFFVSIVLFSVASLACGLAPSLGWLIVARIFQAWAAAAGGLAGDSGRLVSAQGTRHGVRDLRRGGGLRAGDRARSAAGSPTTPAGTGSSCSTCRSA